MHQTIRSFTTGAGRSITELVSRGSFADALALYEQLHGSGEGEDDSSSSHSFMPSVLKACASSPGSLPLALQLHSTLLRTGRLLHPITANSLLYVYSKHSDVTSARQLFDTMPLRDDVTWSSMVNCYVQNRCFYESLESFREMHRSSLVPKPELTASVLSVCGRMGNLRLVKEIHARAVCLGTFHTCVLLSTALLDVYLRCSDFAAASRVFSEMPDKNEVSWTAMITGCMTSGNHDLSLQVFRAMAATLLKPNRVTLVAVLPSCGMLGALKQGMEIHGYIFRHGLESEVRVAGALVDMYWKCQGGNGLAFLVFNRTEGRDVTFWSMMIGNCSRYGDCIAAMKLFNQMKLEGIRPNSVTMLAAVASCIGLSSLDHGLGVHGYILKTGLSSDVFLGNSLIDMYAKCGCLDSSIRVFGDMPTRDLVSWSSMISSFGLHGHGHESLRLFNKMQEMGMEPDRITLLSVLSACKHSGLLEEGKELFDHITRESGHLLPAEHYACYIDLLGRSGRLEDACEIIKSMPVKPSMSIWTSLASACRVQCRFEAAEQLASWLINLEPKNAANCMLLSMVHAETGNWAGVEGLSKVMKERGLKKISGISQINI